MTEESVFNVSIRNSDECQYIVNGGFPIIVEICNREIESPGHIDSVLLKPLIVGACKRFIKIVSIVGHPCGDNTLTVYNVFVSTMQ
jgi:hypothetical protein